MTRSVASGAKAYFFSSSSASKSAPRRSFSSSRTDKKRRTFLGSRWTAADRVFLGGKVHLVGLIIVWLYEISSVLTHVEKRYEGGWVPPPPVPAAGVVSGIDHQRQPIAPIDLASSEDDALGLGTFEPSVNGSCSYIAFYDVEPHSACLLPNPQIRIRRLGVNRREMKLIVNLHNELRSRVAQGVETRGQGGGQPPAAFMMELTWDDELAMVAQGWASQGYDARRLGQHMPENAHDCNTCRSVNRFEYVGQNVAWASRPRSKEGQFLRSAWAHHIKRLYDEVDYFNPKYVARFRRGNNGHRVGHYTQIVWGKSSKIGCGAAYYDCFFSSRKRNRTETGQCLKYVCNYGPAGNFVGEPVYPTYDHKSRCVVKSTAFPGLCSSAIYNSSFFDIPMLMSTSTNDMASIRRAHQHQQSEIPATTAKKKSNKRRRRKKKKHTTLRPSSTSGYQAVGNPQMHQQPPMSLYASEGQLHHQEQQQRPAIMRDHQHLSYFLPKDSVRVVHTHDRSQKAGFWVNRKDK